MSLEWKPLSPGHIEQLFGKTTVLERPVAFRSADENWYVVLRGTLDDPETEAETLWWSLCRIEAGETVELARDYGVEEVDGEVVEVSWDGLFPRDWVDAFVEGRIDWIRLSVTEVLENFGDTVRHEQPQAWRHREGRWYLVLVGELDQETEEEEYAWSLVEESCGEFREAASCHPGNDFGEGESPEEPSSAELSTVAPPDSDADARSAPDDGEVPHAEPVADVDDPSIGDFLDGWWEEAPFAWAERMLRRIQASET